MSEQKQPTRPELIFELVRRARNVRIEYQDLLNLTRRAYIAAMLQKHSGNICRAARDMGLHRNTLSRQMATLGIMRPARRYDGRAREWRRDD